MKCPKCKKNTAFLWNEDGIQEPTKDYPVEIKCGGICAGNLEGSMNKDPIHIADLRIDIIVKRGSIALDAQVHPSPM
jgi:hypothetical protein